MPVALVPYAGAGTVDDPYQPAAPGPSIDLRADPTAQAGFAIVVTEQAVLPPGSVLLGADLDAVMSTRTKRDAGAALGVAIVASTVRALLPELLLTHATADGTRWRPLEEQRRSDGARVRRIWLGELAWEQVLAGGPGAKFSESFNQPDSTILGPDLAWEERSGDWATAANELVPPGAAGVAYVVAKPSSGDQYAKLRVTVDATGRLAPLVRGHDTAATYYTGEAFRSLLGRNWRLIKTVAGTATVLASSGGAAPPKDVRVEANGSEISLLVDGVVTLGPITDTEIAGSDTAQRRVGIETSVGAGNFRADSFEAGDLGAAAITATIAGASTSGGTAAGRLRLRAAAVGATASGGTAAPRIRLVGALAGAGASSGTAAALARLRAAARGASTSGATAAPVVRRRATVAGASTSGGVAGGRLRHVAGLLGAATSAGVARTASALQAALAGGGTSSGTAAGRLDHRASAGGAATSAGTASAKLRGAAAAAGASSSSGAAIAVRRLAAAVVGGASSIGSAGAVRRLAARIAGASTSAGTLRTQQSKTRATVTTTTRRRSTATSSTRGPDAKVGTRRASGATVRG